MTNTDEDQTPRRCGETNKPKNCKNIRNCKSNKNSTNTNSVKKCKKQNSKLAAAAAKPAAKGKNNINFIQLNCKRSKRATDDLVLFAKNYTSPIMLVQEPYANGKNVVPVPAADFRVVVDINTTVRPRACIFYHKCLDNKIWFMDSLTSPDCTTIQTKINGTPTLLVSCYMDRLDSSCPPVSVKNVVDFAKKNSMALIIGTDANAHNTYWHSSTFDKNGTDRGNSLQNFMIEENLFLENVGDTPTFDNGRWKNVIDLTLTNKKGHELLDHWQVVQKDEDENSSDHEFITYKIATNSGFARTKFRDIYKTDWVKYREELEKNINLKNFDSIVTNDDIDTAAQHLADNIIAAYHASCSEQYTSNRVRSPPWETAQVREAKAGIRSKLRQARSTKSDKDWSELRSHQAEYNRLVNRTKKKKFKDFCEGVESKSVPKRVSTIIKNSKTTRLGTVRKTNGTLTESPIETLEAMVETHFGKDSQTPVDCSSGASIKETTGINVVGQNRINVINTDELDLIFSPRRVEKALNEFDPLSAAGPDGIRPIMLQKGWDIVHQPFINIAKASYGNSHTPDCWSKNTGIFLPKPGKKDYYNTKSYRTITLSPVPLKWMERLILWHMEVDLKIYSKLNKRQYGFTKGASTETALHKIVHKIEKAILNSGMALGTFLDVEGAFDNISFDAIKKALENKCDSIGTNAWIMSMISHRTITVEIHGNSKTLKLHKGCPQGGILSPFLWNLVIDSLLNYKRDQIPCDMQAFADDLTLLATLETSAADDKGGFDADTLREATQKSLNTISAWCAESGLTLSTLKTHAVMFTWRKKWSFSEPLTINGEDIKMENSTKLLGVTLDSKLTWHEHIVKQCNKAKNILMQCRRVVGPTWGFTPVTMKWIYTAIVRPCLSYGSVVWINGLKTKRNLNLLISVQRLANTLVTGALPSTPGTALDRITGITPIDLWINETATKGALRLKATGHWISEPMVNTKGNLTSHTKIINKTLESFPLSTKEQDSITPVLNLETHFSVEICRRDLYEEMAPDNSTIHCYTDGSKSDTSTGAGVYIMESNVLISEESLNLGSDTTVFQAETYALGRAASHLIQAGIVNKNIVINCDSQAAIRAVDNIKIKSKTTHEAVQALNTLGMSNHIIIRWIPAHCGYVGNEKADLLAKRGASNIDSTIASLPVSGAAWNAALRDRTAAKNKIKWSKVPPSHFSAVWRDKFSNHLNNLSRGNLRKATQFLTGHAALNYHLNKYKPHLISKNCPHCFADVENIGHYVGQCPKWSAYRSALFESFYLSATDIVDKFDLSTILNFINATGRLDLPKPGKL